MKTIIGILGAIALSPGFFAGSAKADEDFSLGWASVDITPDKPVAMRGGIKSKGVMDPITATVLAMESGSEDESEGVILISCDLQHITDGNRYEADMLGNVRQLLKSSLPDLNSENVIMMATHTHVAPSVQSDPEYNLFASATHCQSRETGLAQQEKRRSQLRAWSCCGGAQSHYNFQRRQLTHERLLSKRQHGEQVV